ncbi:squalene/phytoene synthase family protein [Streptomyces halobius]|uniref:Squalene/phytoene synthase family protein n=1 Tax=Streptomyces halobius TaxID=2879846 RepID=A0ABY4LYS2_9ACTN|nr:squalene/phytoene synthase family protein [Streptomyces halobius]UQA90654.1 squalene/phytoene synthase family protein [Streptomyces halobius]
MTLWSRTLHAGGVRDERLRADYTTAAHYVARLEPFSYPALRTVLPPAWQPHLLAAHAFARHTDDLADLPPTRRHSECFHAWAEATAQGLTTGDSTHALLRAFLHTVAVNGIPHAHVRDYLAGQARNLSFAGFATDADYYRCLDSVVVPYLTLICSSRRPRAASRTSHSLLWLVGDAGQRVDDLADFATDLRVGRLHFPQATLTHFGVTRADLESGRQTPAVRAFVAHACRQARAVLDFAQEALRHADAEEQLLLCPPLVAKQHLLGGIERQGADITRRTVALNLLPSPAELLGGTLRMLHARMRVATTHARP